MKETLTRILVTKEGYSKHSAEVTAEELYHIDDVEIHEALMKWIRTGERRNVTEGDFNCKNLMETFGMKYPAALIFVDWYRNDPVEANKCLAHQGG